MGAAAAVADVVAAAAAAGEGAAGPTRAVPEARYCIPDSSSLIGRSSGDKEDL
jgi:hypothetical protein